MILVMKIKKYLCLSCKNGLSNLIQGGASEAPEARLCLIEFQDKLITITAKN